MTRLIFLFSLINFCTFSQAENKELQAIDSLNLDCFQEKVIYSNDTIIKEKCIERNAIIFTENKSYTYLGTVLGSSFDTISSTKIYLRGTNQRFKYSLKTQMLLNIEFERFKNDSSLLDPLLRNSNCCNWRSKIESGVVENVEKCWMRAFRNNQFRYTETVVFPFVNHPLEINKEWSNEMNLGNYG